MTRYRVWTLGALMLANDQSLFEMAQGLAARAMRDVPSSDPERIRLMFRRCLSREPTPAEAAPATRAPVIGS